MSFNTLPTTTDSARTMTETPPRSTLRLAAVGDLLLTTRPNATQAGRGLEALSDEIRELFAGCDLVLANLECTLTGADQVPTEPRVFASASQIRGLAEAGINLVTLGNNHAFDGGDLGFQTLKNQLDDLGIQACGAGLTLADAARPVILEIKGLRIAVLAVVDGSSGMYRFATHTTSGVAPFEMAALRHTLAELRQDVDHIIFTPHWGEERFRCPSPEQIAQARALIDAGATLVLGHHPHVPQGMELYHNCPIAYSLGNFLANDVYWDNGDVLTWNRFERTGCILLAELDQAGVRSVQQIPVYDDGRVLSIDTSGRGERYLTRANRYLERGITPVRYRLETLRVRTLLPILTQLRWNKLRRLRPGHLRKAIRLFVRGIRP
ncbi:CapA family protein [Geoalkalibacter sp.]|uniref:CapA family protein n=1 Tax=Geoalkalibacter sp. TaxID=3041440 RepID=UPI00272DF085|nr:CapA family protein [Geoalkalibacter sp.]